MIGWTVMKEKELFVISGEKKNTGALEGTLRTFTGFFPQDTQAGAKKEGIAGSYLFVFSPQGGTLKEETKIKPVCQHKLSHLLGLPVGWKEYLAVSCSECKDIKLLDLTTEKTTVAFSGKPVGVMCGGWHKLFVHVVGEDQVLQLDCSTNTFIQTKKIKTGTCGLYDICFIPRPIRFIVACGEKEVKAVYSDTGKKSSCFSKNWTLHNDSK